MTRRRLIRVGSAGALAGLLGGARLERRSAVAETGSPVVRVRFVRHAQSALDLARTVDVPVALPPDDALSYPLTSIGMQQALALGTQLEHDPVLAVVSSPRMRCVQTADAAAFATGTTVEIADGLVDVEFGEPAVGPAPTTYLATMRTISRWMQGDLEAHTPGGESLAEVRDRFVPAVQEIIDRAWDASGDLVLVSHSTVLSAALPFFFANLSPAWTLANMLPAAGIVTGERDGDHWRCTDWNGLLPG